MPLTRKESYLAMFYLIDDYYYKPGLGQVGCMLGDIDLMYDGSSGDPALLDDWNKSRIVITNGDPRPEGILNDSESYFASDESSNTELTDKEAYLIMIDFLEDYINRGYKEEVKQIIDSLKSALNGGPDSSQILENWHKSIIKAKDICAQPEND